MDPKKYKIVLKYITHPDKGVVDMWYEKATPEDIQFAGWILNNETIRLHTESIALRNMAADLLVEQQLESMKEYSQAKEVLDKFSK